MRKPMHLLALSSSSWISGARNYLGNWAISLLLLATGNRWRAPGEAEAKLAEPPSAFFSSLQFKRDDGSRSLISQMGFIEADVAFTTIHSLFNRRSGKRIPSECIVIRLNNGTEIPFESVDLPHIDLHPSGRPIHSTLPVEFRLKRPFFEYSLDRELARFPTPSWRAKVYLEYGNWAAHNEHDLLAERYYRMAIESNRRLESAWNNLGVLLSKGGKKDDALDAFGHAIACSENSGFLQNRGDCFYGLGRFEEALVDYDAAVSLAENKAVPLLSRGNTLLRVNCAEEARADYQRISELAPVGGMGFHVRAIALDKLGRLGDALVAYRLSSTENARLPGEHKTLSRQANTRIEQLVARVLDEAPVEELRRVAAHYKDEVLEAVVSAWGGESVSKVAQEFLMWGLRLFEAVEDKACSASIAICLGSVLEVQGNLDGSAHAYVRGLQLLYEIDNRDMAVRAHVGLSLVRRKQHDSADECLQLRKAMDIATALESDDLIVSIRGYLTEAGCE